ncbi:MAG: transporter, partial [Chitinophagales bacterium]|nr:transporter [Chitinophagales bacterium]
MKKLYTLFTMLALSKVLLAQSPADLQFVPQGNICAGLSYGYSSWDHYWEGDTLRTNDNVGNVTRQQITAGFNIGILDRLNLIVMLPYIFTNTNSGTLNGQSGISDISLNLKGKFAELTLGKGKIFIAGNLGFSTPVSNYLVDYGPVNIGNGTTNLSYRQMFEYKFDKGLFINAKANYTYRSNVP